MPKQKTEGWFNQLVDGRVEVFLKAENIPGRPDCKVRASGTRESIDRVADWFEQETGLRIDAPWRSKERRPIEGQLTMDIGQLSLQDATVAADG